MTKLLSISLLLILTMTMTFVTTTLALTTKLQSLVGRYNSTSASSTTTSSSIMARNQNNNNNNNNNRNNKNKNRNEIFSSKDDDDSTTTPLSRNSKTTPGNPNDVVGEAVLAIPPPPTTTTMSNSRATAPLLLLLRDDEPNLYNLPSTLHLAYRSVPIGIQCLLGVTSIYLLSTYRILSSSSKAATAATYGWKILFSHPVLYFAELVQTRKIRSMIRFGLEAGIVTWVATKLIQEYWFPPSRVTTDTLLQDYVLPSSLSRFERLSLCNEINKEEEQGTGRIQQQQQPPQELGIHYLQYDNPLVVVEQQQQQQQQEQLFDKAGQPPRLSFEAMYLNHGFGASSLSWLLVLPKLVRRLGIRVGLGHDAVGFGFTERPKQKRQSSSSSLPSSSLYYYSPPGSATIGLALLNKNALTPAAAAADNTIDPATTAATQTPRPIILMGHSLGSIATLHMALQLPSNVPKLVILVAPALGLRGSPKVQQPHRPPNAISPASPDLQNQQRKGVLGQMRALLATRLLILCQVVARISAATGRLLSRILLDPVIVYILRRVVGTRNFWNRGLQMAWGNPQLVSESDALRFAWPSIGVGWERGLLSFARAQAGRPAMDDAELFQRVVQLPHTTIQVIVGSKDRVVSPAMVRRFVQQCSSMSLSSTTTSSSNNDNNDNDGTTVASSSSSPTQGMVNIQEMEGLGHDPFEENVDGFVELVEQFAVEFLSRHQ